MLKFKTNGSELPFRSVYSEKGCSELGIPSPYLSLNNFFILRRYRKIDSATANTTKEAPPVVIRMQLVPQIGFSTTLNPVSAIKS